MQHHEPFSNDLNDYRR